MPSGVYNHKSTHKPNCPCGVCKAKRGEYKGKNSPLYGKHHTMSEETIQKIIKANTGKIRTEETIQKMIISHTGKHFSEETCRKIGEGNTGKVRTEETIQKMRKPKSEEHCKNISLGTTGENNSNWAGGLSNFPYPLNFNNKLKELIRERDNHTCQLCGRTEEQEGKKLSVHHIDYIKENLDPNNLLTLCSSCNAKVNYNREGWIEFFRLKFNILKEKL